MELAISDEIFAQIRDFLDPARKHTFAEIAACVASIAEQKLAHCAETKRGRIDSLSGCGSLEAFHNALHAAIGSAGESGDSFSATYLCVVPDNQRELFEEVGPAYGLVILQQFGRFLAERYPTAYTYRDGMFVIVTDGGRYPALPAEIEGLRLHTAEVSIDRLPLSTDSAGRVNTGRVNALTRSYLERGFAEASEAGTVIASRSTQKP